MTQPKFKRPEFIGFFPNKWRAGCAELSNGAEYVFFKLCIYIWDKGKPVPLDRVEAIVGWVPVSAGRGLNEVLQELQNAEKIKEINGGLINLPAMAAHKKALNEMKAGKKRTEAAREALRKKTLTPGKDNKKPVISNKDSDKACNRGKRNGTERNGKSIKSAIEVSQKAYEDALDICQDYLSPTMNADCLLKQFYEFNQGKKLTSPDKAFLGYVRKKAENLK